MRHLESGGWSSAADLADAAATHPPVGANVDVGLSRLIVLSVPIGDGFARIATAIARFVAERALVAREYTNVWRYGAEGATALGWWRELGFEDPR